MQTIDRFLVSGFILLTITMMILAIIGFIVPVYLTIWWIIPLSFPIGLSGFYYVDLANFIMLSKVGKSKKWRPFLTALCIICFIVILWQIVSLINA